MDSRRRFTEEFRIEAVKQITERGFAVKNVCRTHGGLSTGPKTAQGRQRCAEAKTIHGNETRAKRADRSRKSAELHQLVDLGNTIGLFNGKVALRGRPPKGVEQCR